MTGDNSDLWDDIRMADRFALVTGEGPRRGVCKDAPALCQDIWGPAAAQLVDEGTNINVDPSEAYALCPPATIAPVADKTASSDCSIKLSDDEKLVRRHGHDRQITKVGRIVQQDPLSEAANLALRRGLPG